MALQGMGVSTFWGFTPAIDLQNAPPAARSAGKWKAADGGGGAPLRVLVAGEGDVRNILRTIAQHRRHPARKLEFYVVEKQLELTARQLPSVDREHVDALSKRPAGRPSVLRPMRSKSITASGP